MPELARPRRHDEAEIERTRRDRLELDLIRERVDLREHGELTHRRFALLEDQRVGAGDLSNTALRIERSADPPTFGVAEGKDDRQLAPHRPGHHRKLRSAVYLGVGPAALQLDQVKRTERVGLAAYHLGERCTEKPSLTRVAVERVPARFFEACAQEIEIEILERPEQAFGDGLGRAVGRRLPAEFEPHGRLGQLARPLDDGVGGDRQHAGGQASAR